MAKVLVDGNYFVTRACYAPNIQHDFDPTSQLLRNLWDFKDLGELIVVFDGRHPDFRLNLLPDYKKKPAKEMDEEEAEKAEHIRWLRKANREAATELLGLAGIVCLVHPDYEADDAIYRLAGHLSRGDEPVYAVTSDSDYFQMCKLGVLVHRPYHNETVDRVAFYRTYGFDVDYYPLFLSMTGTHNGVPGIHGIGPKKAAQVIAELDSPDLEGLRKWCHNTNTKLSAAVRDGLKIVKRNMVLVDLDRVPLTEGEMAAMWLKARDETRMDYRKFLIKAKELKVGNAAKWVPYLLGKKGK